MRKHIAQIAGHHAVTGTQRAILLFLRGLRGLIGSVARYVGGQGRYETGIDGSRGAIYNGGALEGDLGQFESPLKVGEFLGNLSAEELRVQLGAEERRHQGIDEQV